METLISKGVDEDRIHKITHGDVLNIGPFKIHVLKGKHIVFDIRLILKTFLIFVFCPIGKISGAYLQKIKITMKPGKRWLMILV
uniref:Uncharacterized protein n=1 Tax=uncultured bacterium contig00062 TaxID=1181545 RepID=A0A806KN64_9BACT|nr:hypothetical protein [uncultured bacterium contig00062]